MATDTRSARVDELMSNFGLADVDDSSDKLIIGLDFGTTYSGVAYVFSTKPDQVYTITEWPGAKGRSVPKTPSTIQYSDLKTFQWGYELDRSVEEKIEGIKLLLDPYQEKPLYIPPSHHWKLQRTTLEQYMSML
ncbi:MAG: hypothetical protein Q9214_004487 [Letrouitia sp. 1 TL-2023]